VNAWFVIAGVAVGTYALRVSMLVVLAGRALPAWTDRPMRLVGPAAVAALVATMLLVSDGARQPAPTAELLSALAGFLAVRRTDNLMHAFVVGLPVFWVLNALGA
jgi:branched-subunit amino acid transport protein